MGGRGLVPSITPLWASSSSLVAHTMALHPWEPLGPGVGGPGAHPEASERPEPPLGREGSGGGEEHQRQILGLVCPRAGRPCPPRP